jgi:hypothetical protein
MPILRASAMPARGPTEASVAEAHQIGGWAAVALTAALVAAAVRSVWAGRRTSGANDHRFAVDRLVLLVATVVAVNGAIGGVILVTGGRPADPLHLLYGPAALVTAPVAWWLGGRPGRRGATSRLRRDAWILVGAALLLGIELRLFATG